MKGKVLEILKKVAIGYTEERDENGFCDIYCVFCDEMELSTKYKPRDNGKS